MANARAKQDGRFFDKHGQEIFDGSIVRFTSDHPDAAEWKFGEVYYAGYNNDYVRIISLLHDFDDHGSFAPFFWEYDGEFCWDLEVVSDDNLEYLEFMHDIDK